MIEAANYPLLGGLPSKAKGRRILSRLGPRLPYLSQATTNLFAKKLAKLSNF
jgi:hypothetical protein